MLRRSRISFRVLLEALDQADHAVEFRAMRLNVTTGCLRLFSALIFRGQCAAVIIAPRVLLL